MPYNHVTAFGTSQGNLSDAERMQAQQGMNNNALAAQMAALNAEIADRQAGRTFDAGQAAQNRTFQGGMFDKNAGLQTALDQSKTARDLGVVGAQMAPSMMDAQLRQREANASLPVTEARNQFTLNALKSLSGGGAPGGAPGGAVAPGGLDNDAMMFMAMGGNPGEYMAQKRQQMQSDRQHQDAQDAQAMDFGMKAMASENPEMRALGSLVISRSKNSALAGIDQQTLQAGLQPKRQANEVIAGSPAIQLQLQKISQDITSLYNSGDPNGPTQARGMMDLAVKQLVAKGVQEGDAQAAVAQMLQKQLPETGWFRDPLRSIGDTFVPGTPFGDQSNASKFRTAIGVPR